MEGRGDHALGGGTHGTLIQQPLMKLPQRADLIGGPLFRGETHFYTTVTSGGGGGGGRNWGEKARGWGGAS